MTLSVVSPTWHRLKSYSDGSSSATDVYLSGQFKATVRCDGRRPIAIELQSSRTVNVHSIGVQVSDAFDLFGHLISVDLSHYIDAVDAHINNSPASQLFFSDSVDLISFGTDVCVDVIDVSDCAITNLFPHEAIRRQKSWPNAFHEKESFGTR